MRTLTQQKPWLAWQYPGWLCILRIILGLFISFKGIYYMLNMGNFEAMPFKGMDPLIDLMLWHSIVFVHFVGGIFIAFGYSTRIAILLQFPLVLGALIMINSGSRLVAWNTDLEIIVTLATLILLAIYFVLGSGRFSVDYKISQKRNEQ